MVRPCPRIPPWELSEKYSSASASDVPGGTNIIILVVHWPMLMGLASINLGRDGWVTVAGEVGVELGDFEKNRCTQPNLQWFAPP